MPPPRDPLPPTSSDTEWYLDLPNEPVAPNFVYAISNGVYRYAGRNAPFKANKRVLATSVFGEKITRGYMRPLEYNKWTTSEGRPLRLFFMWNPTEIDLSYQIDESVYDVFDQPDPGGGEAGADPSAMPMPGTVLSSFQFSMVFDRQIEANLDPDLEEEHVGPFGGVRRKGILHDFEVFDAIVRRFNTGTLTLQMVPVSVIFSPDLMLSGYTQAASKRILKFNSKMVPILGTITLTMQVFYMGQVVDPAQTGLSPGGWIHEQIVGTGANISDAGTADDDRTGGTSAAQPVMGNANPGNNNFGQAT